MSGLTALSLAAARDGLARKEFSARELTEAHLAALEAARALNAFVTETPERALAMAAEADRRLGQGEARPLEGLPLAIKDLFCTQGVRTTAGSRILENFVPPYESTVTANLWRAGAVLLGKTNLDEFAMGSSNVTSYFGPVVNPWTEPGADAPRVPGGSSGGSAAAVAAELCLGATGTDTGGSIRQPAALCGIVGMKPTYGRCSRFGIVAFASSLDQAGPLARTVQDCAILLAADGELRSAGQHQRRAAARGSGGGGAEPGRARAQHRHPQGVPARRHAGRERRACGSRAPAGCEDAGCSIREIGLPHAKYALPAYYIVNPAEASSNLARYDGMRYGLRVEGRDLIDTYSRTRAEGFGKEVRRRVMIGTYVLSAGYYDAYYLKAQKVRTLIKRDFEQAFEEVDLVLTPSTPGAAFRIGDKMDDPVQMWLNDVFTVTANLAGLPGISVPAGLSAAGLPLGLQLIGRPFDEATVLRGAGVLEAAAGFGAKPPWLGRSTMSAGPRTEDLIEGASGPLGGRDRPRGARPGALAGEAVLGRLGGVRRRAQPSRLADRCRHAGHAAVGQPPLHRAGGAHRASACARRSTGSRCSSARTTSIPTCRAAIRSRNMRSRSSAAGSSRSTSRTAAAG